MSPWLKYAVKLVAVTVHFANPEQTTQLLTSLVSVDSIHKIVTVLHGSYPSRPTHPKLIFLESENRGYGAGLNLAFHYIRKNISDTDLILALNPDVQISDSQIQQLVDAHLKREADCTFPAITEGSFTIHGYDFGRFGTIRQVEHNAYFYPATCFVIATEAWDRVHGFDEEYFHYFEDADFCLRLRKAGCKIHHASEITVRHLGKSGMDYPATELPRYAVRNHLLFLFRIGRINALTFLNVAFRQLLYLFRWNRPWRGIAQWLAGIREFQAVARTSRPRGAGETPAPLRWVPPVLLAVICLVAYSNSFYPQFQFDDIQLIRFNFALRDPANWQGLWRSEPFRPVSLATFALNFAISKTDPFSYHLFNLLIHFAAVCLFYVFLRRTSQRVLFCMLAAALMAAHPLNTESVTYIAGRSIVICAGLYFLCLLFFDSYVKTGRRSSGFLCVAFFVLAVLAKEEAATIPIAILLYNFCFHGSVSVRRHGLFHFLLLMAVLAGSLGRIYVQWVYALPPTPSQVYLPTEVVVWLRYLWLAIAPISLNVDHMVRAVTFQSPEFWLALMTVVLIIAGAWKIRFSHPAVTFWALWFFLNLLPSSVFPLNDFMAEHRTYVSMFGFCAGLAYLTVLFERKKHHAPWLITGVLMFQVLFYTALTLKRNQIWSSEVLLWSDSVAKSPDKIRPHLNLGWAFIRASMYDEAIHEFSNVRAIDQRIPGAYNGLGFCFLNQSDFKIAEENFRRALQIKPDYIDPKTGLGIVCYQRRRYAEALHYFEQVYPKRRESADLIYMMADCYLRVGQREQALELIQRGMELHPTRKNWTQLLLSASEKNKKPLQP